MIFNSYTQKLPSIRRDIDLIPIEENGRSLLFFYDSMGYMPDNFALDASAEPFLSLLRGFFSIDELLKQANLNIDKQEFLHFIQLLDKNNVLDSARFRLYREKVEQEFEESNVREPFLSDRSYPGDEAEFQAFLDQMFETHQPKENKARTDIRALYAPHIDMSIGKDQYAEAFSALAGVKPKRVIILGTSHYAGLYYPLYEQHLFIGSDKTFKIPGREFKPDSAVLDYLEDQEAKSGFGFSLQDRAHRVEHSIETHLVFLSQIWKHNFSIVPILVSGFDEILYHPAGEMASNINSFTKALRAQIDDDTFVLISGDLSHVGRKFGDQQAASEMKSSVQNFDHEFLDVAKKADPGLIQKLMGREYDKTRICGFSPLYTYLNMFPDIKGEEINYYWWDETERESAVSFGSLLYS
ncbi:MAG TPA: AmmeMemoRadiSam system protein B [Balneolaceae bacterium]|nr:AmmeMemoRadiSam system protein B [Balneolaceae bacterium]